MTRATIALATTLSLSCRAGLDPCGPGQMLYEGRPPAAVFGAGGNCLAACSTPRGECSGGCDDVLQGSPRGVWVDGRALYLVDIENLAPDRALVFRFAYDDEAFGDAPAGWKFRPASYANDQLRETARFNLTVFTTARLRGCETDGDCAGEERCVAGDDASHCGTPCELEAPSCAEGTACTVQDDGAGACALLGPAVTMDGHMLGLAAASEIFFADPGRLDLLRVDEGGVAGEFFLAYETATGQRQGQLNGCFDLAFSSGQTLADGAEAQLLGP